MLCNINGTGNFFLTWGVLTLLGLASQMLMSGVVFLKFYITPTFKQWQNKSNPKYPDPTKIRGEIIQMMKGLAAGTLAPAISLWLISKGIGHGYCGTTPEYGYGYTAATFMALWLGCDFYEFFYHHLGHRLESFWAHHKHHHHFPNPTPFAVIADEYVDMFVRALPLLVFPLFVPINLDMMFFQFAKGNRTVEKWSKVSLYDYSILLEYKFWATNELDAQSKIPKLVADTPFSMASAKAVHVE
eukprot:gene5281-20501_t